MILSIYFAMMGLIMWFHFSDSPVIKTIGIVIAGVCMGIANFKHQRILNRLRKAESESRENYKLLGGRISDIERKMDDDGK